MKKIIIASVLAVGLVAGIAYAHNGGYGWGGHMMGGGYGMMGPGMMGGGYGMTGPGTMYGGYGDCPGATWFGEDGWDSEAHQSFLKETEGLRREFNDKRFEYQEARRDPNTDSTKIADLEKELYDIQAQLRDKARQLQ